METHKPVLHKELDFPNGDPFSRNQINLLASAYQERVNSLNRAIEQKEQEVQRLRALLAKRDSALLSALHPVTIPSTELTSTWFEVQDAKARMIEYQAMQEEEAAQKVRLQEQIQHLNHQLEIQSERHSKDLQRMNKRIERSKILVQQLDDRIGRDYDEAALKNILDGLREKTEFELRMFQENITEAYDQNVAMLVALQTSDQMLLDHEKSENLQLLQRTKTLKQHATALHSKVLSEETQRQMLAGMFEQERRYNQHCLQALQEQIEDLWQRLCEFGERSAVQTPLLPQDKTEMVMRQQANAENRRHKELTDGFWKSSGEDCSKTWGQTESVRRITGFLEKEESEGKASGTGQDTERGMFGPAISPSASALAQGDKLQDSQITQESLTEKDWSSSHPTANWNPMSRATACVKIEEVDRKGCFVRLFNTSPDKNVDLSGYTLQQRIGAYPISLYRFPQHTWLPKHRYLTVWSAEADISQRLPTDLVWEEQRKFQSGPQCTTALCKSNGQAVAWYIPSHRFSAAANSFDVKDDASDEWVSLDQQQISRAVSPQEQCMKDEGWAPIPETAIQSNTQRNNWIDFVPLRKRGSFSAFFNSKSARPQSNTSSLTEHSSLWSHSLGEIDIYSYPQSSLISLPSDSLPGLITPDSSSPRSPVQTSRRSIDVEGLNLTITASWQGKARLVNGWVTQKNARPKYGLRFMSYPRFTTDTLIARR